MRDDAITVPGRGHGWLRLRVACMALAALVALHIAPGPAAAADAFELLGIDVSSDRPAPEACLNFTAAPARAHDPAIESYVRIEPATDIAIVARDKSLCIRGLAHGASYRLRLLPGLPAEDGAALAAEQALTVAVPDRTPSIRFPGQGYVLPKDGGEGLPVTTINVASVHIEILRVGERNLVQQLAQGQFGQPLAGWSVDRLASMDGEKIFSGTLAVREARNQEVTTAIPLAQTLGTLRPGAYVATATPINDTAESWQMRTTQWFTVTDLSLVTYSGDDGLTVLARSLEKAGPVAGVTFTLVAQNNEELGHTVSDAEGQARFPAGLLRGGGGDQPKALFAASGAGDFTFLELDRPALDLTDRGVDGRTPPGAVDAFLYTDRGIYRPGETVHLGLLLRDAQGMALEGLPVSLRVLRPDQLEVERRLVRPDMAGGTAVALAIAADAASGLWQIEARLGDDGPVVGRAELTVDDFVPPRLEVALTAASEPMQPGGTTPAAIAADYLYGAPGAALRGEVETVLQPAATPFPEFKDFRFGLVQEPVLPLRQPPLAFTTGPDGKASVDVTLPASDALVPLEAVVTARVFDLDGRPAETTATVPVRTAPLAVGIRPGFSDNLPEGSEAAFDLVAIDRAGKVAAGQKIGWELVREDVDYIWFAQNGRWDYRVVITDTRENGGEVAAGDDGIATVKAPVANGRYRLEAFIGDTGIASSFRFTAGWWGTAVENDRPDRVEVSVTASATGWRAFVKPPYDASVILAVADGSIRHLQEIAVTKDGAFVDLPAFAPGPGGAYLLATAIAPAGTARPRLPTRAVGVAWVPGPAAERQLGVAIDSPERIQPNTTLHLPVTLTGIGAGESAYVTLAAVDDAILGLTDFATPAPGAYFFGQRRLGVELRDLYGRLIDPAGERGRITTGGDAAARIALQTAGLEVRSYEAVALFAGPVAVDAAGKATVDLAIPDFNGRLRLMAVAWTTSKAGSGEARTLVRPPLIAELTRPRFLAPGDRAQVRLQLQNLDAPDGAYTATFTTTGPLAVSPATHDVAALKAGGQQLLDVALEAAQGVGTAKIALKVDGPEGFHAEREWSLAIRPASAYVTDRTAALLDANATFSVDAALAKGFVAGTTTASLSLGSIPPIDLPALLAALDRFPYGCAEQTVSTALPWLFRGEVQQALDRPATPDDRAIVALQRSVQRLVNLQASIGGFGAWTTFSPQETWLSAYVLDFLLEARKAGYPVPDGPLGRGLDWLGQRFAAMDESPAAVAAGAYAADVLVRAGRMDASLLRYAASRFASRLPSDLARAQLAAALHQLGDDVRAREIFATIGAGRTETVKTPLADYGSPLRDAAGVVTLAVTSGLADDAKLQELAGTLDGLYAGRRETSTQEQAWLMRAAGALASIGRPMRLEVNGVALPERRAPWYGDVALGAGAAPLAVRNAGSEAAYRTLSVTGIPAAARPAEARGFTLARRWLTLDGKPANLLKLRQNDQLVAIVEGTAKVPVTQQALLVDLLPAGLELEDIDPATLTSGQNDGGWLGQLTATSFVARRDDRFVAALDLGPGNERFRVAYVVRAVTPGSFTLPGSQIEEMYRPERMARGEAGKIAVAAR